MQSLVKNAADAQQVKEAEGKEKRGRERELGDVAEVLSTVQGRRFMWRYLTVCGIFKTSYSSDANNTFYLEGQRNIGLQLIADVNEADPTAYVTMMQESNKESRNA